MFSLLRPFLIYVHSTIVSWFLETHAWTCAFGALHHLISRDSEKSRLLISSGKFHFQSGSCPFRNRYVTLTVYRARKAAGITNGITENHGQSGTTRWFFVNNNAIMLEQSHRAISRGSHRRYTECLRKTSKQISRFWWNAVPSNAISSDYYLSRRAPGIWMDYPLGESPRR
jgi:hypothetical protein